MRIIKIEEAKKEKMSDHCEKALYHLGKLMTCIEDMGEGGYGERDDDDDDEMIDKNRYFFNGKIITKDNVPYNWNYTKMLKDYKKLIYINDNFCYPYDDETDSILHINI